MSSIDLAEWRTCRYVVLEGTDGSGKTSQSKSLVERLQTLGHKAVWTREPGSPLITFNVRDFLLGHDDCHPDALELLFEADRAQHTAVVKKYLDDGYWVVSDRSYISGLAYAMSCGHSYVRVLDLMKYAIQTYPDHVFYLDVPADVSQQRRIARGEKATREEAKGTAFQDEVRQNFGKIFSLINQRTSATPYVKNMRIDGTLPIEKISEIIDRELKLCP